MSGGSCGFAVTDSFLGGRKFFLSIALLAIALAEVFFFCGYQELVYDAWGYYILSQRFSQRGFLGLANEFRAYGYPLFVAFCSGFRTLAPEAVRFAVFHVQILICLAGCVAAARRLGRVFGSEAFAGAAYAATALNPFLLIHATETLPDALSAVLVFLAVLLCVPETSATGREARSRVLAEAVGAFFCASFAVMVRPSNVTILISVAVLWLARQVLRRELRLAAVPLLLTAAILPFLPQLSLNARAYGRFEPLVVSHPYRDTTTIGMELLKFGAWIHPGDPPQLRYGNPLYRSEATPKEFLRRRPAAFAATLGLHLFAMLDHDLPFTYVTNPRPWYRWPLSVINYAFLFLSFTGIGAAWRRRAGRSAGDPETFAIFALLFSAAAYASLFLPAAVESRYCLPLDLLLTPFFVISLFGARDLIAKRRWAALTWVSVTGALFAGLCALLSAWIAAQASQLAG